MWLPRKATTEEKLTTLPLPCSTITGMTGRQHRNGAFMSRLMVWSQTEGSTSVTGLSSRSEPPAQFSSTSTRPKASLACCTIRLTLSSSVTSVRTKRAPAPASRAVASPSAASSSATTTLAPSATNSLADARPMPEPAPVITATLPARRFICFLLLVLQQDPRARADRAEPALLGIERRARIELAALRADPPADDGAAFADFRRLDHLGRHAPGHRRPEIAVILCCIGAGTVERAPYELRPNAAAFVGVVGMRPVAGERGAGLRSRRAEHAQAIAHGAATTAHDAMAIVA